MAYTNFASRKKKNEPQMKFCIPIADQEDWCHFHTTNSYEIWFQTVNIISNIFQNTIYLKILWDDLNEFYFHVKANIFFYLFFF